MKIAAASAERGPRGAIIEIIDGCNIQCPTCIAGSLRGSDNPRSISLLQQQIDLAADRKYQAILLSGGEPTIHPDFFKIVEYLASISTVHHRILITNGLAFARDSNFATKFVESGGRELEVFLQFDTSNSAGLLDIRGADYSRERIASLDILASHEVRTTLVNVSKRGVTLDEIPEILDRARIYPNICGVQFQPIRDAGRVLNYNYNVNSCEVADIFDMLPGGVRLAPCVSSPWTTFLGTMDRKSGTVSSDEGADFYISRPTDDSVRIAVLDYSDRFNWTTDRSTLSALDVVTDKGVFESVDSYFLGISEDI